MTNRLTTNSKLVMSLNTLVAVMTLIGGTVIAHAQGSTAPAPSQRVIIKFATTDDFPPFNSRDFEGALVGFNIDLAQLICRQLQKECEITPYPWERLFDLVNKGEVDAVIAGHRVNVDTLAKADFTRPYFRTPGRFAVRRNGPKLEITPDGLDRRTVGVAKGTAHEAFLNTFFRTSRIMRFDRPEDARNALRTGKVDTMFSDGISLVFWVNGTLSQACCDIAGGPFLEPMFFGDGLAIGVKKGNRELRVLLDRALNRLRTDGRLVDLVQRHFPRTVF